MTTTEASELPATGSERAAATWIALLALLTGFVLVLVASRRRSA